MSVSKSATDLKDVVAVKLPRFDDDRGSFLRVLDRGIAESVPTGFFAKEIFVSRSSSGIVRGMHFQRPPEAQKKLVFCISGRMVDVLLDLRKSSSTYGRFTTFELSALDPRAIFVPHGVAHGFVALEPNTLVGYAIDGAYSPEHDAGIHWASFGYEWPVSNPVTSPKDSRLPDLSAFQSPF